MSKRTGRGRGGDGPKRAARTRGASHGEEGRPPRESTGNGRGAKPNRGILKERRPLIRVAQLSFRDESCAHRMLGAEKIAAIMRAEGYDNINKNAVLALQRKAFADGLLRVSLRLPWETARVVELEQDVKRVLGLKRVLLVPGFNEMLDDGFIDMHRGIHRDVTEAMAERVVEYLCAAMLSARRVAPRRPFQVGVAWGYTLNEVAQELLSKDRTRTKRPDNAVFLPIIGTTWNDNVVPVEANSVATNCARAFAHFPSPAFVPRTLADGLRQVPQIGGLLERAANCNLVITGMGPLGAIREAGELRLSSDPDQNTRLFESPRVLRRLG
jgi:DNA-binding transcriptional regulator LsrR (DeoR family)